MDDSGPRELDDKQQDSQRQQNLQRVSANENGGSADEIHFCDITPAIEFVCWVVVALSPLLRLINGAAVTDDQFVIQVSLCSLALAGGVGLRIYNFLGR
jgi:hypothetical protein